MGPIPMQLTLPSTLPALSLVAPSPVLPATPPVRPSTRCPGVEGRKGRLSLPSPVLLILVRLTVVLPILVLHIHRLLTQVNPMLALLILAPLLIDTCREKQSIVVETQG